MIKIEVGQIWQCKYQSGAVEINYKVRILELDQLHNIAITKIIEIIESGDRQLTLDTLLNVYYSDNQFGLGGAWSLVIDNIEPTEEYGVYCNKCNNFCEFVLKQNNFICWSCKNGW